jgi:hypothetical protein
MRAIEIAEAVDGIRTVLRTRINQILHIPDFWQHVRTGVLKVTETRTETTRLQDGSTLTRNVDYLVDYAPIQGHAMLEPGAHEIARQLKYALTAFRAIEDFGGYRLNPISISDQDRRKVAKILERGLKKAASSYDEIEDVRRFLQPVTLSTIAAWGRHLGAPANFHAALDGRTLQLGKSLYEYQQTQIPEDFFGVLPDLPRIGPVNIDDAPEINLDPAAPAEEEMA